MAVNQAQSKLEGKTARYGSNAQYDWWFATQEVEVNRKQTEPVNEALLKSYDDMISLDMISEPLILHNVKQRYEKDIIYVRRPSSQSVKRV